jgi:hypothetical protein
MMNGRLTLSQLLLFGAFLFLLLTAFIFQTTIWFNLLGTFPSPNLWIAVFVYLMLNRQKTSRQLWLITIFLMLLTCTAAVPLQTFVSLYSTFFIIQFIQSRFSTLSIFDLVLFSAGAVIAFPFLYACVNFFASSAFHFDWLYHIGSLVLSLPLIPGILMICRKMDRLLNPSSFANDLVLDL